MVNIYVVAPYELKDDIKTQKGRWDPERRMWYFIDRIPNEFKKYEMMYVDIPYSEKDEYKENHKSLRWEPESRKWICSLEDFNLING